MSMCLGGNCVPIFVKKCDSPPVVLNSEGTPPEGPLPIGHTHNYTCSVGYIGFWESYTTCQDNGKWSEVVFQCIDICIAHGNRRIGTWCYFFTTVKATRTDANALCTNRGMYLSRIETSQEWNTLRPHINGTYWISGYAQYSFWPFRDFYWSPGVRMGFTSWLPGQPDNSLFNQFDIRIEKNGWDDEYKHAELTVLCEADY
ncbi:aggrecan core protein-like [Saccostrea cucullata]|uniref:aggrecan core protein-like n=1 Tax=Saccostrea cuccullata TaxID=36930 RepID=UPI002ED29819